MPTPPGSRDTSPTRRETREQHNDSVGRRPQTGVTDFERHVRQLTDQQRSGLSSNQELERHSETTEQLSQHLRDLFRNNYQNVTPRQQHILDSAMEVSTEMTQELNIRTTGFGDQKSVMLGDILQGGARTGEQASITEEERQSDLYQELKESFFTRLKDKIIQVHENIPEQRQDTEGQNLEQQQRDNNRQILETMIEMDSSQLSDTIGNMSFGQMTAIRNSLSDLHSDTLMDPEREATLNEISRVIDEEIRISPRRQGDILVRFRDSNRIMHEVTRSGTTRVVNESVVSNSIEQASLEARRNNQLNQVIGSFANGEIHAIHMSEALENAIDNTSEHRLREELENMNTRQLSQIADNVRRTFFSMNQPRIESGVRILGMIGSIRQEIQEQD
jgi:hypothetical protein